MKKIALSLVALSALSTAALANGDRTNDYTTLPVFNGQASTMSSVTDNAALAVNSTAGRSAYERMVIRSQERERGER